MTRGNQSGWPQTEPPAWHEPGWSQLAGGYRGQEAVYGFGRLTEVTERSFGLDVRAVFADDEHGVALAVSTASRGGRSLTITDAHIFHLRDGKVAEFWNASPARTPATS